MLGKAGISGNGGGKWDKRVYDWPTHVIGIIFAEDEASCVLIHGVCDVQVAYEWRAEEGGDVCVVHSVRCPPPASVTISTLEGKGARAIPEPNPSTSKA